MLERAIGLRMKGLPMLERAIGLRMKGLLMKTNFVVGLFGYRKSSEQVVPIIKLKPKVYVYCCQKKQYYCFEMLGILFLNFILLQSLMQVFFIFCSLKSFPVVDLVSQKIFCGFSLLSYSKK